MAPRRKPASIAAPLLVALLAAAGGCGREAIELGVKVDEQREGGAPDAEDAGSDASDAGSDGGAEAGCGANEIGCRPCRSERECPRAQRCDTVTQRCFECTTDEDCEWRTLPIPQLPPPRCDVANRVCRFGCVGGGCGATSWLCDAARAVCVECTEQSHCLLGAPCVDDRCAYEFFW